MSGGIEDFDLDRNKIGSHMDFETGHMYKIVWKFYPDEVDDRVETGCPAGEIISAELLCPATCMKECLDEWIGYDLDRKDVGTLRRQNADFFSSQEG